MESPVSFEAIYVPLPKGENGTFEWIADNQVVIKTDKHTIGYSIIIPERIEGIEVKDGL